MYRYVVFLTLIFTQLSTGLALANDVTNNEVQKIFTDQKLSQVLSEHTSGVIYIWSPFMPMSVEGRQSLPLVCKRLQVPCFFITGDAVSADELPQDLAYLANDSLLQSGQLISLGVYNHYPSYIAFKDGALIENIIFGMEYDQDFLYETLNQYLTGEGK